MKALRKSMNLINKRARRRWRASLPKPPSIEDTQEAMEALGTVASHLRNGDITCMLAAADLLELYAGFIREFGQGDGAERCQAGNSLRGEAAQLRTIVFLQFDFLHIAT